MSEPEIEIERVRTTEAPATQPCHKKCQILHDSSRGMWPTVTAPGFKRHTATQQTGHVHSPPRVKVQVPRQ